MAAPKWTLGATVVCAVPTASTSVAIPAGTETLLLAASGAIHFRITLGASTAVVTDQLITPGILLPVHLLGNQSYTLSAIFDTGATTGSLTATVVQEA